MRLISAIVLLSFLMLTSCSTDTKTTKEATKEVTKEVKETMMPAKVQTISLEQTSGEFNKKTLTLKEGTYIFEISNKDVDHNVGFVLAPKGKTNAENHIKEAYVTAPVATGSMSKTKEVVLTKGEYVYFCPLNPTPEYSLVVN